MRVFISGNFNVVHPGHIRLFKKALEFGTELVVGVLSSKISKNNDLFPDEDRVDTVENNSLVDQVILVDRSITETLHLVNPDIIIKGTEFEGKLNEESEYALRNNKRIIFTDGDPSFSQSNLISFSEFDQDGLSDVARLIQKSNITQDRVENLFKSVEKINILVIGDFIVDEYVNCEPIGLSQEDANVVLKPIDSAFFLGGASIVARHARGMGAKVKFLSVLNDSSQHVRLLENILGNEGIGLDFVQDSDREPIVKTRFRVDGTSRFRITKGSFGALSQKTEIKLLKMATSLSKNAHLIIFSDFNYGVISKALPGSLIKSAPLRALLSCDSQISSQIGDLTKYSGIDFLSATEFEARVSTNSKDLGLAKLISQLRTQLNIKSCIIKLGKDGLIYETDNHKEIPRIGAMPALNRHSIDTAGAGDSLLAAASSVLCVGANLREASFIGSIAAAIQVARIGNEPVTSTDIINLLKR